MLMRTAVIGLTLATGLALAGPVAAQGLRIGPDGVRVDPGFRGGDRELLSRGEAVRIARREGLVDVDNVSRRGPRFVIDGSDRRGNDLTVVVDGRSGDVVDVRR